MNWALALRLRQRVLLAAAAAGLGAYAAVPAVRRQALRLGVLDMPGARRIHDRPVPRWGGLAIYLGFLLGTVLAGDPGAPGMTGILAGSAAVVCLGASDDMHALSPAGKLLGQAAAAAAAMAGGVRITALTVPGGAVTLPGWLSAVLTLLWLTGMSNAINLMDGLDGLAAGLTLIGCGTMLAAAALSPEGSGTAVVVAALAGACLGFLPWNRHPASIFMGDAGSLLLGFVSAAASAAGLFKSCAAAAFSLPLLVWALPIADTVCAFFRRLRRGTSPFRADREHIHHRLLAAGLSQPEAAAVLCGMSAVPGFLALAFLCPPECRPGLAGIAGLTAAGVWRRYRVASRRKNTGEDG
ncbi:MAG: undecaprenyl/decaprenyl-phosphate alpha-N-acetylglucosaminyl 1-phosphate transferase [Oscillospiraceae bacterium]|nr:undecaprenyl/decaprenyl-phosphate alpha-N-acetylglucosaminyl 1-phosphate transferase [Oscillospiraceae bacterium]